jgi:signal transduction histidine kinase
MARWLRSEVLKQTLYFPQSRAARLVATGRVVLAALSLFAIWLDPAEPAKYAEMTYTVLVAYVLYALLLAIIVWRVDAPLRSMQWLTHAGDLLIFSSLMYLTEGPTSPFFVYFLFSLLCATLYWQWRGIVWTAVVALVAYVGLGVYAVEVLRDTSFELNRFIMRSVHLVVVATLLSYLNSYHQRLYSEMAKLAAWPHVTLPEAHALVRDLLHHAADILGAPRALMVWEESEEPWLHLALWSPNTLHWTREPPATFEPYIAVPLADASFLCVDVRPVESFVLYEAPAGVQRWYGTPLHRDLAARFGLRAVLAIPLKGEYIQGHLLFLDCPGMTIDALLLGAIIAREVIARMELYYMLQQLQQVAVVDERIRLARDLHDGVLQSLTGAALHLAAISRLLETAPEQAQERLAEVQEQLATEQRDLRFLIQALKPAPVPLPVPAFPLTARLQELSHRVERQWGLHVVMQLEALEGKLTDALRRSIYHIVHEALINAARHASAATVQVAIHVDDQQVHLTVSDTGCGFPFHGQYDLADLTAMNLGPMMLRERVAALGGTLTLDSTAAGTCLDITVPYRRSGA